MADLESSRAQPAGTKNADDWSATDSQEFKLKLRTAWPDSMTPTWHYAGAPCGPSQDPRRGDFKFMAPIFPHRASNGELPTFSRRLETGQ